MAIEFSKPNGGGVARIPTRSGQTQQERPAAQVWINVGYYAGEGEEQRFISLPQGIPLDTMDDVSTRSSNQDYASMQAARNSLKSALLKAAEGLAPGQDEIVNLQIQIRRVAADTVIDSATNQYELTDDFAKKLVG